MTHRLMVASLPIEYRSRGSLAGANVNMDPLPEAAWDDTTRIPAEWRVTRNTGKPGTSASGI
jgi:hypothetical protein